MPQVYVLQRFTVERADRWSVSLGSKSLHFRSNAVIIRVLVLSGVAWPPGPGACLAGWRPTDAGEWMLGTM